MARKTAHRLTRPTVNSMRDSVFLALGACIALAIQIIFAPSVSILGSMPNFLVVFVGVASMFRPSDASVVTAFFLGMAFDLVASGTPGVMSCLLTVAAFVSARASVILGNDTLSVSLLISMAASLFVEVCYALFYVATTDVTMFDAILLRGLPCALYDCAVCLIVMPLLSAAFARQAPRRSAPESSTIRLR